MTIILRTLAACSLAVAATSLIADDAILPEYAPGQDLSRSPAPNSMSFSAAEWKRFDRNHDGVIQKREARDMDVRVWTYADLNADGKISRKEWDAVSVNARRSGAPDLTGARPGNDWGRLDFNGDGWITRREAIEIDAQSFSRLDTDGDGRISKREWSMNRAAPGVAGRPAPSPPPFRRYE